MSDPASPFAEELRIATAAARLAGDEVRRLRESEAGVRYGHKEGMELVSEADLHAAQILDREIRAAFPDDGWLSEEAPDSAERLTIDRTWIVDPIDGTREFLLGVPEYAVSVALCVRGVPRVGVVYNPAADDMATAIVEDDVPLRPTLAKPALDVLVGRRELQYRDLPPLPRGTRVGGVGSMAYRLALLARGEADAVTTAYGRSEWDVAAGVALCLAAGLRVTDALGGPMEFNQPTPWVRGILAGTGTAHETLLNVVRSYR